MLRSLHTRKRRLRPLAVMLAIVGLMTLHASPALSVSAVDISPGWQNAGTDGHDCWSLSADDTVSSTDMKFYYGNGSAITWTNVGGPNWFEFECYGFGVQCSSTNFYQTLDHLNGSGLDTSTTYIPGTTPC